MALTPKQERFIADIKDSVRETSEINIIVLALGLIILLGELTGIFI